MNVVIKIMIVVFLLANLSSLVLGYYSLEGKLVTDRTVLAETVNAQTRKRIALEKEVSVLEQSRIENTVNLKSLQEQSTTLDKQLTKEHSTTASLADQKRSVQKNIVRLQEEQDTLLQERSTLGRAIIQQRLAQQAARRTRSS